MASKRPLKVASGTVKEMSGDGIVFDEIAAPGTPAANTVVVYAKADGHLYQKDDAGTETDLASGGGGTTSYMTIAKWE